MITPKLTAFAAALLAGLTAKAEFSLPSGSTSPGHGLSNVLAGSIDNGALFWQSTSNWLNAGAPAKPYSLTNDYALPACDSISVARLAATIWGGTANYISKLTITINGAPLPGASPLTFGSTADANPVFSPGEANAYGSGSGVWLVTLPIPPELLRTDGGLNTIVLTQNSDNGFDGRVQHVTLLALYQRRELANQFDYSIAEGGGDLYRNPAGAQVSRRTACFAPVDPWKATAATLHVLYTYGDGNNDRLYFNDTQYGDDNVADWNTATLNNGPSVVQFDVLSRLEANNRVLFSLGTDVPAPQETSLRPQLAVLTVSRPAIIPPPLLAITGAGQISWTTNSAGFLLESSLDLGEDGWRAVTNEPALRGDQFSVPMSSGAARQFFRLRKSY